MFKINSPGFHVQNLAIEKYGGGVFASVAELSGKTESLQFTMEFETLSSSKINLGNFHRNRVWRMVPLIRLNDKSVWEELPFLPVQVCAEIGGKSRDVVREKLTGFNI